MINSLNELRALCLVMYIFIARSSRTWNIFHIAWYYQRSGPLRAAAIIAMDSIDRSCNGSPGSTCCRSFVAHTVVYVFNCFSTELLSSALAQYHRVSKLRQPSRFSFLCELQLERVSKRDFQSDSVWNGEQFQFRNFRKPSQKVDRKDKTFWHTSRKSVTDYKKTFVLK